MGRMKRIDKYSLFELAEQYDGFKNSNRYISANIKGRLLQDFAEYCNEEVPTHPRIQDINTVEDIEKAYEDWRDNYQYKHNFLWYLKEEVEGGNNDIY